MDMLGLEQLSPQEALDAIKAIASVKPSDEDPIAFDLARLTVETINATAEEPGHQITGEARIGSAVIPIKIEISHGHVVSPAPVKMIYPTVLPGTEAPEILCYTAETMLAEKFEAICSLGKSNSRFKDFYDVRELSRRVNFEGATVAYAFKATFGKRRTPIPETPPESFLPSFCEEGEKGWRSFLSRLAQQEPQSFAEMVAEIEPFAMRIARWHGAISPKAIGPPATGGAI
jgi:Nucleotidyl transferase AbiEii toxin, Type IV TA system